MMKKTDSEPDLFKRRDSSQWSQLPRDLIRSVFKRLSFGDFERGKSVCRSWYTVSRECFPKNQIPWLILFPDDNNNNCCKLFNPEEKDNIYTTQDLGFEKGTKCVATCGCWLLMQSHLSNFYIVDLLTGERIILPPVQSQLGNIKIERIVGDYYRLRTSFVTHEFQGRLTYACQLWVDEETKDYLVMWTLINDCVVICKKGDKFWRQIPDCSGFGECRDMVYKDHKLYLYDSSYSGVNTIRVSDFSGEVPRQVSETIVTTDLSEPRHVYGYKQRMVVTVSGDVLLVTSMLSGYGIWLCEIYGMNSSTKEWEKVVSLGDEAMVLDLGITVKAQGINRNSIYSAYDIQGIDRNSIYFSGLGRDENLTFIFDLETKKFERPYQSVSSSIQNCTARWFFPNFSRKILI